MQEGSEQERAQCVMPSLLYTASQMMRVRLPQQFINSNFQYLGNDLQFNIGDKSFTGFNPLHSVFVNVKAGYLKAVGQCALRDFQIGPQNGDFFTA